MRAILGVCGSDKVQVGRGSRVRFEAYTELISPRREESGIAKADLDKLAGVQASPEAAGRASEGYGMGHEVWSVWSIGVVG